MTTSVTLLCRLSLFNTWYVFFFFVLAVTLSKRFRNGFCDAFAPADRLNRLLPPRLRPISATSLGLSKGTSKMS